MSKYKLKKSTQVVTAIITMLCLLCGIITPSAFAATLSPSKKGIVEIYQLAPETTSLIESYVIKTPNGKLIVIDGGIDGGGEEVGVAATPYLTAALRSIAGVGEGEHFTVDAWFVSHAHTDHYLELAKLLCAYTGDASYTGETVTLADNTTTTWKATPDNNFTIKNFYFDFPEESEWSKAAQFTKNDPYFPKFIEGLDKYAKANRITINGDSYYDDINGKVVNQKAIDDGLTITIDGVDFEILQTWSTGDGQVNSNSMVIRVVNDGSTALFLNDATVESGDRLLKAHGVAALKSDIVQLGHHGQNGCSKEFYDAIDTQNSVRLWAASSYVWRGESSNLQTKEVRSWFGLPENYLEYVGTRMDFVPALYDAFPVDKTSVAAWNDVIDGMKITLPTEPVYRTANEFDMIEGATLRVGTADGINGLRFSAIMKNVDTEAEYGFVIVPKEYMETITSDSKFDGDYIKALTAKYGTEGIIKMGSMPIDRGNHFQINGSVGNIKFENAAMEYSAIAYKYKGGDYTYAAYDAVEEISANPFNLATKAYTEDPNGTYAAVYKEFVDNAVNLINGNPQGTEVTAYNLNFDKAEITLYPGEQADLRFTTDFDMENVTLQYDADIISYDMEKGKVSFVKCGTTQIQASCMGVTASVNVSCTVEIEDGYLASFDHDAYADLVRKNEFPGRSAADVKAEKVNSYADKNGVIETNVMKITTKASSGAPYVSDFTIDLPKAVSATGSKKAIVRILFADSDAKWLAFRNVKDGAEYYPSEEVKVAPNTGLTEAKTNVWMNVTIDYSQTDAEYMDRLTLLVQGGAAGGTHTIYVSYVVEADAVKTILANELPNGYLATFDDNLYTNMIRKNEFAGRGASSVTSQKMASYRDKNGVTETNVMKITTTAASGAPYVSDFTIDLPKALSTSGSKKATVRLLIAESDASWLAFRNVKNGAEYYPSEDVKIAPATGLSEAKTNVWMDIVIDYSQTDADAMDRLTMLIQNGAAGATHTIYIAYVIETDAVKDILSSTLPSGYLADFSSNMYAGTVTSNPLRSTPVSSQIMSSYTDANGVTENNVVKITTTAWNSAPTVADFAINLPKAVSATGSKKVSVRLLVKQSDATFIGFRNRNTNGEEYYSSELVTSGVALPNSKKNVWMNVEVDFSATGADYMNQMALLVQGGANSGVHEFYISYVVEKDVVKSNLAANLPTGYVADFSSPLYSALVTNGNKTGNSVTTSYLPTFQGESGVMKVTVKEVSGNAYDFALELPKAHTGSYTLKMWVSEDTDCGAIGVSTSAAGWGKYTSFGSKKGQWQTVTIDGSSEGYNNQKISIMGWKATGSTKLEVYLAWIYDGTPTAD